MFTEIISAILQIMSQNMIWHHLMNQTALTQHDNTFSFFYWITNDFLPRAVLIQNFKFRSFVGPEKLCVEKLHFQSANYLISSISTEVKTACAFLNYTVSHKKRATLFLIITPVFLGRFLYFLYQ